MKLGTNPKKEVLDESESFDVFNCSLVWDLCQCLKRAEAESTCNKCLVKYFKVS